MRGVFYFLLTCVLLASGSYAGTLPPDRGIYWDYSWKYGLDGASLDNPDAALADLKAMGIKRVHIWLNDQPRTQRDIQCDQTFAYSSDWNRERADKFVAALQSAGFHVALTISPWVTTQTYLDSLAHGPLLIARDAKKPVDIEYDMEANWTDGFQKALGKSCKSLINSQQAEAKLVAMTREISPRSQIGLSVAETYLNSHGALLKGSDWISPQAYRAGSVNDIWSSLQAHHYNRPVWFAISAQTKGFDKGEGPGLTRAQFAAEISAVTSLQRKNARQIPGYLVWGRREINSQFSDYGSDYLHGNK